MSLIDQSRRTLPGTRQAEGAIAVAVSQAIADLQPLLDEVVKCGKCGSCLPACPVYRATGLEPFVARGKNQLLRGLVERRIGIDTELERSFENCLMCRACTAHCPPAVRTDAVVRAFRESHAEHVRRSFIQSLLFRHLLPRPSIVRAAIRVAGVAQQARLDRLALRSGMLRMVNPKLDNAVRLGNRIPSRTQRSLEHSRSRNSRGSRRIGYWVSCGYNYFIPHAGVATADILADLDAEVDVLGNNCCGLPAWVYGDTSAAQRLAVSNLKKIGHADDYDYIVSDCASCASHLKEYGQLLSKDAVHARAAEQFSKRVRSLSELLAPEVEGREWPMLDMTVTFHEPCHLGARYQDVVCEPRDLIRSIPGVRLVEMAESDSCCGAAGAYGIVNTDVSMRVLERKIDHIAETGATTVVTECPACMMQIEVGLRRRKLPIGTLSLSQLMLLSFAQKPDFRAS